MHNINQDILITSSLIFDGLLSDNKKTSPFIIVNRDDYFQLKEENKRLQEKISYFEIEIHELKEKVAKLSKTSKNSSKSPSSDIVKQNKKKDKEKNRNCSHSIFL